MIDALKPKIVFHIGMGKTGTTSVQRALRTSADSLAKQNARYLGMWFDMLSPAYNGLAGDQNFFREPDAVKRTLADAFFAHIQTLRETTGAETFVMSNESLFAAGKRIQPFLERLTASATLQFVLYVRDPRKWLPSAYAQWGMVHKTKAGPLRSFSELAPELLLQYQHLFFWHAHFPHTLVVRSYDHTTNVVADFASAVGLQLDAPVSRLLERPDSGELALRAFFNSKFDGQVLPGAFSAIVPGATLRNTPSLTALVDNCFDYSEISSTFSATADVEALLRDQYGITFEDDGRDIAAPAKNSVKDRVLDLVIGIVLDQAARITELERVVFDNKDA